MSSLINGKEKGFIETKVKITNKMAFSFLIIRKKRDKNKRKVDRMA